ncbi:MAG: hypothetical protein HOP18_24745 [Deltaproteobacteria bacterium]|nr:hypothetical protein [Deltaproteobacteria bacterium]
MKLTLQSHCHKTNVVLMDVFSLSALRCCRSVLVMLLLLMPVSVSMAWERTDEEQMRTLAKNAPIIRAPARYYEEAHWIEALVDVGQADQAYAAIQQIEKSEENKDTRAYLLVTFVEALGAAGQAKGYARALEETRAAVLAMKDQGYGQKGKWIARVAAVYLQAGNKKKGHSFLRLARTFGGESENFVLPLTAMGQGKHALTIGRKIRDAKTRFLTLSKMAALLEQQGQQEIARRVRREAQRAFDKMVPEDMTSEFAQRALAETGSTRDREALQWLRERIARRKPPFNEYERFFLLPNLIEALARSGQESEARQVWQELFLQLPRKTDDEMHRGGCIRFAHPKEFFVRELVTSVARGGQAAFAYDIFQAWEAQEGGWREEGAMTWALLEIALAFAKEGNGSKAFAVIKRPKLRPPTAITLERVIEALGEAGRKEEAEQGLQEFVDLANATTNKQWRADHFGVVSRLFQRIGKDEEARKTLDQALAVATQAPQEMDCATLNDIARAAIHLRDYEAARLAADQCQVPEQQLRLYEDIFTDRAKMDDPELRRRIEVRNYIRQNLR